jgi:hypothetical protein
VVCRKYHALLILLTACVSLQALAQAPADHKSSEGREQIGSSASQETKSRPGGAVSFWHKWFERVTSTQAAQPHWITPLATTTPRLEEEFRFDMAWQQANNGIYARNYGLSKGLELIPARPLEIILGVPPYVAHNQPGVADGFGDVSFLMKYRMLSANEEKGNYIVTLFLGATAPTGQDHVGALNATLTPTLAAGKGFGNFDIQTTFGAVLPLADSAIIGRSLVWNTAVQYRVLRKIWPEVEANSTFFVGGPHDGMKQVFITPGFVLGRFHLWRRVGLSVGAGTQIAVTHFHTNNHNWILSVRFPF